MVCLRASYELETEMNATDAIGLARIVAWPFVVLAVAVAYRREIAKLVQGLSGRISRLSVGGVTVDLAAIAPTRESQRLLDEFQNTSTVGPAPASGVPSLVEIAKSSGPVDYLIIDLRGGKAWLTSRLYLCAEILAPLLAVKCLVFVATVGSFPRYFLGLASPASVATALRRKYVWLAKVNIETHLAPLFAGEIPNRFPIWYLDPVTEAALACLTSAPTAITYNNLDKEAKTKIALDLEQIRRLMITPKDLYAPNEVESFVNAFLQNPDMRRPHLEGVKDDDWTQLDQVDEHARWIPDERRLLDLLGENLVRQLVPIDQTTDSDALVRTIVRHKGNFTAVVDADGRFKKIIDRVAILERVASQS
jgi:hypothetical protein